MPSGNANASAAVQTLYRDGAKTRMNFGDSSTAANEYYSSLIQFVSRAAPITPHAPMQLLDVGCGCGWSSFWFAKTGYITSGVDMNGSAFEPPLTEGLHLLEGSALDLPFTDKSFDVVVTYQCLEHIPDPEGALIEMMRTLRIGGVLCVVGPNLLAPSIPIKDICKDLLKGKISRRRTAGMPYHPYGNTTPERIRSFVSTTNRLANKLLDRGHTFDMREPDINPPFHGDNDACYLCNPIDLIKFFRSHGFRVVQNGKYGRPSITRLFVAGTWVAVQKIV